MSMRSWSLLRASAPMLQQATRFEFFINLQTAKLLGIGVQYCSQPPTRSSNSSWICRFTKPLASKGCAPSNYSLRSCCDAQSVTGVGHFEPPSFAAATAELASIADADGASRPSTVGGRHPATGAPQKPDATAGGRHLRVGPATDSRAAKRSGQCRVSLPPR